MQPWRGSFSVVSVHENTGPISPVTHRHTRATRTPYTLMNHCTEGTRAGDHHLGGIRNEKNNVNGNKTKYERKRNMKKVVQMTLKGRRKRKKEATKERTQVRKKRQENEKEDTKKERRKGRVKWVKL